MNNLTNKINLSAKNKFKRYLKAILIVLFSLIILTIISVKLAFNIYPAPIIHTDLFPASNISIKNSQNNSKIINLMVWNIHKNDFHDNNELKNYSQNNDLILLQEAPTNRPINAFATPLNSVGASAFSFFKQQYGTLTLSKFPRLTERSFNLAEPLIRIPKSALISEYLIYGHKVLVINVHQINFTLGMDSYAKYLNEIIRLSQNYQGAVILGGDFNSWSKARINFMQNITAKNGFTATDFTQFSKIDLRAAFLGNKLDQIFVKGLEIIDARADKNTINSDHRPLFVKLKFIQ